MADNVHDVLHRIHTATNDVLEGYGVMLERAEPEIRPVLIDLSDMHKRHASEQETRLRMLTDSGAQDRSLRGTMNKIAVTARDWVADLDRGSLTAVRRGEEALQDLYDDAMTEWTADSPDVSALLTRQYHEIGAHLEHLPKT